MNDVERLLPPDDTGARTFARYCYQSRVAFRYLLACAADRSVAFLVAEHFEDVAVQMIDGQWLFVQIKTRDLSRGPWRIGDVLAADGAFRSLARSCAALAVPEVDALFVASLEGAIAAGDDLQCFVGGACTDTEILARVADRLGLTVAESAKLLPRLRVIPEDPMSAADAVNIRRLGACMPTASQRAVEDVYDRCLSLIQHAMEATVNGPDWAVALVGLEPEDPIAGKKLDQAALAWLRDLLSDDQAPLLSRLVTTERPPATQLEEKLLAGGATPDVIADAIEMRALADRYMLEQHAASPWDESEAERDLDMRLTYLARASVARFADIAVPANVVWAHLHERLSVEAATHDPRRVMAQDPVLLQGRACGISDQCGFEWRPSNA